MGSRLGGVGRLYERELEGLKGGEEEKKRTRIAMGGEVVNLLRGGRGAQL